MLPYFEPNSHDQTCKTSEILIKMKDDFQEHAFEYADCKTTSLLVMLQCVQQINCYDLT